MLTDEFRADVEKYLVWCEAADVFAADARPRPLAPRTLKLRRNQIHAAVTALVESGRDPASIKSVADLVSVDAFKCILRRRHEAVGSRANNFNRDLAELLVQIAREWVKVDARAVDQSSSASRARCRCRRRLDPQEQARHATVRRSGRAPSASRICQRSFGRRSSVIRSRISAPWPRRRPRSPSPC